MGAGVLVLTYVPEEGDDFEVREESDDCQQFCDASQSCISGVGKGEGAGEGASHGASHSARQRAQNRHGGGFVALVTLSDEIRYDNVSR